MNLKKTIPLNKPENKVFPESHDDPNREYEEDVTLVDLILVDSDLGKKELHSFINSSDEKERVIAVDTIAQLVLRDADYGKDILLDSMHYTNTNELTVAANTITLLILHDSVYGKDILHGLLHSSYEKDLDIATIALARLLLHGSIYGQKTLTTLRTSTNQNQQRIYADTRTLLTLLTLEQLIDEKGL